MAARCLHFLGLLGASHFGVKGGRVRVRSKQVKGTKFIAGVPILHYHSQSLSELDTEREEDWIVILEPSTTDAQIAGLCKLTRQAACVMTGHPNEGGVPFVELRGTEAELKAVLEGAAGFAKFVEPNPSMNLIPDDDIYDGSDDGFSASATPWHIENIGRPGADRTGRGVHVYVMDTGVRVTHQDLGGRAIATLDVVASPSSPLECAGDPACARDVRGHGTHCAGLVGGVNHGTAPESTIHAVKVLDDQGAGPWSNIIGGLDWIAQKRVRPAVASLSLGGPGVENSVAVAVDVAVDAGVTVVVASGNFNSDACDYTPAFAPSALTVGAIASNNAVASFSNYGPCTNIWAPGFNIMSLSPDSDTATTKKSGTSMACPLVAGGAALILEASPDFTPAKVKTALSDMGVRDSIIPYQYGGGMKDGSGDTNLRLYVGAGGGGDLPAPTPAPSRRRWFR